IAQQERRRERLREDEEHRESVKRGTDRDRRLAPPPVRDGAGRHLEKRGDGPGDALEQANLGEAQSFALEEDHPARHPQDEHEERLHREEAPDVAAIRRDTYYRGLHRRGGYVMETSRDPRRSGPASADGGRVLEDGLQRFPDFPLV